MKYKAFLQEIKKSLSETLGPEYSLILRQIPKNNGVLLDGLCIGIVGENIAPTIYLNEFYGQYLKGRSLKDIEKQVLTLYHENTVIPKFDFEHMVEYPQIRDKIVYKLIHADSNKVLLQNIPYIPYLDMAIVFYILLEEDKDGQMISLIHNEHQALWEVTTAQIYEAASRNTPALLPPYLKSIIDVMREIAKVNLGANYKEDFMESLLPQDALEMPLYVLSNTKGLNGACCMLYSDIVKNFADSHDSDIIILPSSIHEVLLIPYRDNFVFEELKEMVFNINHSEVSIEDRLSDQVYYYSKSTGQITLVPISSESDGTKNP